MEKPISGESLGQPWSQSYLTGFADVRMVTSDISLTERQWCWPTVEIHELAIVWWLILMMYIGYIIMYISHDHPEYKRYRFSIVFPLIFQMISEQTAPFQPGPCRMPQPAVSAAEIMCRHCGRYFNPEAAERHIPICANVPWVSSVILGYPWGVDQNPWWLMITIWLFKIAMENGPFIDGLPIKTGDFPWLC
jgi:hypothetical protein